MYYTYANYVNDGSTKNQSQIYGLQIFIILQWLLIKNLSVLDH